MPDVEHRYVTVLSVVQQFHFFGDANTRRAVAALQMAASRMPELLATSNKLVSLDPSLGFGHFFGAVAKFSAGQFEEAEKSALQATQAERGRLPQAHLLLARIYQRKGDTEHYAKQLRSYLQESPKADDTEQIRVELSRLQKR